MNSSIVISKNSPGASDAFSTLGSVRELDSSEITAETVRDADTLIVRSETRVDRPLLENSAVRFVGTLTIGTDHVDLKYLKSRNIGFASAPGSNANSVAEYVVAALLTWADKDGIQLREKSIGIVGVGNVGRIVAKYAAVLGMRVILNDPPLARVTGDPRYRPLDELMEADIVTVHVPLTRSGQDATVHLFGTDRIRAMKRGSVLINTSRGAVVDSNA
ncbi:MAG: 4-phosphoerythronate dehydrogenase, partial [Ignavibacteriales bacterium]|nr:4-phosphoerythronate dehydrogenase [Ignavibacteriales bacterium]